MTYPEPYLNPLRPLYPGMSKGSSYWGGSLSGLGDGEINDKTLPGIVEYNTRSAKNNNWGVSEFAKSIGVTLPGNVTIAALAASFQRKYGLTVDGKIGPKTLKKIFSVKRSMADLNNSPSSQDAEYIVLFIEPRMSGLNPPSPYGGGGGGGGGGRAPAPTPRRSMSDGDEMNLDFNPPPKPKTKKSLVPMPLAIGGGVLIAVGLALFIKNKNDGKAGQ
jgi:hypothetical protein